jgi:hypothetical protein
MKVALVFTSGLPVVGREAQAIDHVRAADAFWRSAAAEGKCSEPEKFWSSTAPVLTIVKGEAEDLQMLIATPECQRLIMAAALLFQNHAWELRMYGLDPLFSQYETAVKEMGLA